MVKLYTLTVFSSAFLLFLIQPMISKLLLPPLGGSPAVWNTAMMVFQSLLLVGYVYAHALSRLADRRKQAVVHTGLIVLSLIVLPISLKTDLGFSSTQYPIAFVAVALLLSVGLPFFALSANAPLLQHWFALSGHKDAANPYFLYGASNAGSLIALAAYPAVMEPLLELPMQTLFWSIAYVGFAVLIGLCVWQMRGLTVAGNIAMHIDEAGAVKPVWSQRLHWMLLAFFPSSLLLGVTTYITNDIATMPLFWVIPLAIYLLTFILAFGRTPKMVDNALHGQLILVPMTILALMFNFVYMKQVLILHLFAFFAVAMGCHGVLSRLKPHPKYLTEFFLFVSLGGMLGGVFNSIIAPLIFKDIIEYWLILVLSLAMRPALETPSVRSSVLNILIPFAWFVALVIAFNAYFGMSEETMRSINASLKDAFGGSPLAPSVRSLSAVALFLMVLLVSFRTYKWPLRFMLCMLFLMLSVDYAGIGLARLRGGEAAHSPSGQPVFVERNFFGINRVFTNPDAQIRTYVHGNTIHGIQSLDPEKSLEPLSYYRVLKPVFRNLPTELARMPTAIIGLGAGSLACFVPRGQAMDLYEIDPIVVRIAQDAALFTFMRDCAANSEVIVGDGRLEIAKQPNRKYGIIVADAFSSDSIPVHLITREALAVYASKLDPDGVIAFNISSRNLNLTNVVVALAYDAGFTPMSITNTKIMDVTEMPSRWVAMSRSEKTLRALRLEENGWRKVEMPKGERVWTDHYSNIIKLLF